jgi:type IV pilus assembly protein PilE
VESELPLPTSTGSDCGAPPDRATVAARPRRAFPTLRRAAGFTLLEMMVVLVIAGILTAVAVPGYRDHLIRSSRHAAQLEMIELAAFQDRIFRNSGAYAGSVSATFTGLASGGLGVASGRTRDGQYTLAVTLSGTQAYALTATPAAGGRQEGDGSLTVTSTGSRSWNGRPW